MAMVLRDCEQNSEKNQKIALEEERKMLQTAIETALAEEREKMECVLEALNVSTVYMYIFVYMYVGKS